MFKFPTGGDGGHCGVAHKPARVNIGVCGPVRKSGRLNAEGLSIDSQPDATYNVGQLRNFHINKETEIP